MTVRTRFAPSPTGSLHVGGARTALYCLLHARGADGQFVLRIEDTDQQRSTSEATEGIQRDLRWLGLEWDEGPGKEVEGDRGPYFQSRRLDIYDRYIDKLLAEGKAYEAWESKDELDLLRAEAEARKDTLRYRQVHYTDADLARFRAEGRAPVVRMKVPPVARTIDDQILGPVVVGYDDLEDFVIRKADGFPTYHFAVVIDDYCMEITLVLRGQEHLMNTAKHLVLYEAFGWAPPTFAHLPLIFNPHGSKMSKRDKARVAREAAREAQATRTREGHLDEGWGWLAERADLTTAELTAFMNKDNDSVAVADGVARVLGAPLPMIEVMDFRRAGYLPEALTNYLALLGWSPGDDREVMGPAELLAAFDLGRVNKTAARFDFDKVKWMNGEYMKRLPIERLQEALALWLEVVDSPIAHIDATRRKALLELYRLRSATFGELEASASFFFHAPRDYDPKAVAKWVLKGDGAGVLRATRQLLATLPTWTEPEIEAALNRYCEQSGLGLGKVAQPLRVALTGTAVSPAIHETLAFFEPDEVLTRIDRFLNYLSAHPPA